MAIAQACESLHHSVTQMSVSSLKYTHSKVKPPRQVHLGRIAVVNISYNGIVRVPVAADCKPSVVAIGSQVEVNIDLACSHVAA